MACAVIHRPGVAGRENQSFHGPPYFNVKSLIICNLLEVKISRGLNGWYTIDAHLHPGLNYYDGGELKVE